MPTKSQAFARMKRALLALVTDIPLGKVAQVGEAGIALNIPPRHVAYILSQLAPDEAAFIPWHRVVPTGGKFPAAAKRTERQDRQIELLSHEGILLDNKWVIANFQDCVTTLPKTHCSTFWADED
jgi:methylated-DNA-protein-cysteine methyltransferase related protein